VSAISKVLTDRRTMLDLVSVREGPSGVRLLQTGMDQQGWTPSGGPLGPCRFIPLAGTTWDTYLAGLGSHHRSNVRRRLREIGKAFDLRFETVTTEGERSVALSNLIKLHDERWRPRGGSMAFRTGAQCAFHEDITRVFLERGWLRLFSLRLNGDVVAALYGFTYGRKFYFYQSGFNPEYGKYSVGLVTMALSIQTAIKEELAEFDMLYGVEQYKSLWATASRQLVRVECGPPGLGQLLHQASVGVRRLRRALLRAWTPARVGGTVASVWSSVDLMVLGSGF
jgi:CelD/BcsL family acetyltransferase involved in cellulose biosynthesis